MDKLWLTDPNSGQKSVSLTFFTLGFFVALGKLVFSGIVLGPINVGAFSGVDFAAIIGSLGSIYAVRKHSNKKEEIKQ